MIGLSTISRITISPRSYDARYTALSSSSRSDSRSAGAGGAAGGAAVAQDDVEPVAEHVGAIVQSPQVTFMGQRPQVVRRGKRQPCRLGQLLGTRTTLTLGDDLEETQCALHRLDQRVGPSLMSRSSRLPARIADGHYPR